MKILIIGSGRVGSKVIETLSYENFDIDVIDKDPKDFEFLKSSRINVKSMDILEDDNLKALDFISYDYVLAITDQDKTNLLIASVARNFPVKTFVRLNQIDSLNEIEYLKESLNIDEVLNPYYEIGKYLTNIIGHTNYYKADYFGKDKIEVAGHFVDMDKEFENMALEDIGSLATILVVAILRGSKLFTPNGKTILQRGDYLYLMGLSKDIKNFKMSHFMIKKSISNRNVTVIGGDLIVNQIMSKIEDINLKIIEEDVKKANFFRNKIPSAFVVNKSFREKNFLVDEDLKESSIFVVMSKNDELNIVLSLMAKNLGVKKTVVVLKDDIYTGMIDSLGLYAHIEPTTLIASQIINKISKETKISVNFIFGGLAQVFEIAISDNFPSIGKALKDLEIPKGIIIGGIIRKDGLAIIPRGNSKIEKGDRLVIFATNEKRKDLIKFIDPNYRAPFFHIFS